MYLTVAVKGITLQAFKGLDRYDCKDSRHIRRCDVLDVSFRLFKVICFGFLDDKACIESEDNAEIKSKENKLIQNLVYELLFMGHLNCRVCYITSCIA